MAEGSYFIPRSDWDKIELILAIDDGALLDLATNLNKLEPTRTLDDLLKALVLPETISEDSARRVLEFAKRMMIVAWMQGDNFGGLLNGAADYFDAVKELKPWDRAKWESRATALQSILAPQGPLYVMSKADALRSEYPAVLLEARIISDARYVFDDDGKEILGAIAAQTLVIEYYDLDYGRKKQFFAFDSSDAKVLLDQLQRAAQKKETISATFKTLDTRDLTI